MNGTFIFPPDTLPLPLSETLSLPDQKPILNNTTRKSSLPSTKNTKPQHRVAKRTVHGQHRDKVTQGLGMAGSDENNRKSRVWKACERCRMKKTKCDGQYPCKRCTDDGVVCAPGHRRKVEFKQLPRGYAEVLESGQHALSATIVQLYKMLQAGESWTHDEVRLNSRNEPVVHDIAKALNTIRAHPDHELQVTNVMPQNEEEMKALQDELWALPNANGSPQRSLPTSVGHSPSPILNPTANMPNLNLMGMPPRYRQNSNSSADDSPIRPTFPGNVSGQVQQQRPLHHSSSEVSSPGSLTMGWESTSSADIDWLSGNLPMSMSPQNSFDPVFAAPMSRGNSFQGTMPVQFPAQMAMPGSPSVQQGGPMGSPYGPGPGRMMSAQPNGQNGQNGGLKGNAGFGQSSSFNPMISGSNTLPLDLDDGNGYNNI